MSVQRSVSVSGKRYLVYEKSGYIKAHLHDQFGWTFVWASDYIQLVSRIRLVLEQR